MRLFVYKVRYDIGFAPNPFHGTCTLATCKPRIRKSASVGDWIIGVGSKGNRTYGRLVFAMQVGEKLSFDEYWRDERFHAKRPDRRGSLKYRYGDNIYHRENGEWIQEDGRHSSDDGSPNAAHIRRDTGADGVLIGSWFTYWGGDGPEIPPVLRSWSEIDLAEPGRDLRSDFPQPFIERATGWVGSLESGVLATPRDWYRFRHR